MPFGIISLRLAPRRAAPGLADENGLGGVPGQILVRLPLAKLAKILFFRKNANFWRARSRLDQNDVLQEL